MSENENRADELNEALKSMWDSLSDEQKEKAKECKSMDELMLCAGKMGIELPDELLDTVAGGWSWMHDAKRTYMTLICPYCGTGTYQMVLAKYSGYIGDKLCNRGKCESCNVYFWQAEDGSTYDTNHNYLGTFKSGCH